MLLHRRWPAALVAGAAASALLWARPDHADASYPHTVIEGETLSGIAAANGMSTDTVASFNGISADTFVVTGQTVNIPSAAELGTTSTSATTTSTSTTTAAPASTASGPPATVPAYWTSPIYSPLGTAYLASNAAANWEAMRQAGLAAYGIDIYPAGSLSAYRTYAQQSYLYSLYLQGLGAPANPPGSSSHEYGTAVDLASPEMRTVVDNLGATYGWGKIHGPDEWWHVDYYGG
jgi:murein DD-endopeptidase MepM/ murein hydrolase activator NlpD